MNNHYDIVDEASPERCQGIVSGRIQCKFRKIPGSEFCSKHGGRYVAYHNKRRDEMNYRLAKYQNRVMQKSNSDTLKSLKDEIGILRMLMEELLNKCASDLDLLQFTPQLADLAMKIGKLVETCTKLDRFLGQYLDKTDVIQFGQEVVSIISEHVKDSEIILKISESISSVIDRLSNKATEREEDKFEV